MTEMKTLTIGGTTFEMVDEKARNAIDAQKSDITDLQTALIGVSDLIGGDA